MKIRFYNREGRWFADLPEYIASGGTEDDCEMVSGADTWIDYLSKGKDSVFITISEEHFPKAEWLMLLAKDDYGANYIAHTYEDEYVDLVMWLCPVTLFVFGKYPEIIYYAYS